MRRCIALACLAFVVPALNAAPARAELRPGHYAGETSNILLGPAQIHLRVRAAYGAETWDVEDLVCGCWQSPWYIAGVRNDRFEAGSSSPGTAAKVEGALVDTTRLEGWGRIWAQSGSWDWRWWARWVAELAPAEPDATGLGTLGEEAEALSHAPGADPSAAAGREVVALGRDLAKLSRRVVTDARQAAVVEGSPDPAPYGPPARTSVLGREKVARLEGDAAAAGRQIRRRSGAIENALRKMAVTQGGGRRRSALDRRLRTGARNIGRDARRLWRELR